MNPFDKDVLTTGEVAKVCNVAARTVSKWFDSGQLHGYRIPGSKDRRIPVSSLTQFMRAHGIPMDGLMAGQTRVLVADDDTGVCTAMTEVLGDEFPGICRTTGRLGRQEGPEQEQRLVERYRLAVLDQVRDGGQKTYVLVA